MNHTFNFNMTLGFTLKMYFVAFSYGQNWQTMNLYNKKMIPSSVIDTTENSSVTIYCGSSSRVTWSYSPVLYYNESYTPDFRRHTMGTKQITLNNLLWRDSGNYYCEGAHEGQDFMVYLLVNVYKEVPKNTVVPNWVEVSEGGSVTLICGSDGPVEWHSVNFRSQKKIIRHNTLTLYDLKKKHSGQYVCRGTRRVKRRGHYFTRVFHSVALVIVEGVIHRVNSLIPTNN